VVTTNGTPRISLETGSSDVAVNYSSGTGTNTLTFNYEVATGHVNSDLDYLSTSALALNSGTIKDIAGNDATLTLASPGESGSLGDNKALVVDGSPPTVSSVSATTSDGTFAVGSAIAITVTFNETVTVSGTPQLTLETGRVDAVVNYSSGSGATLTFNYTVVADNANTDLDYNSTSALALNSGTIRDAVGNNAILTLVTPGDAGSLAANKALNVAGAVLPTISSSSLAADNSTIAVTMSEAVYNTNGGSGALEASDFSLSSSGFSLNFDGSNDYVNVGNVGNYSSALTVMSWIKKGSQSGWDDIISGGNGDILFAVFQNKLVLGGQAANPFNHDTYSTTSLNDNTWHHVAATYDANGGTNNLKIYVDGTLENQATKTGTFTAGDLRIGSNSSNTENFNGLIYEVVIWNDALSAAEITALYNSGSGLSPSSNSGNYTSSGNLKGYWNFNEGTGTTLTDQSANGNSGTISGASWSASTPFTYNSILSSTTPTSISASGNVYTLGIGLSGTPNGSETLIVSPVDDGIYDYSGNEASTSQSNNTASVNDKLPATIASVSLAADNSTIAVTMSEAVYNTNGGSGALTASDFALSISGGTADITNNGTPTSFSASGNVYTLGIGRSTLADGSETLTVLPADNGIYDASGNESSNTTQSNNTATLNDKAPPTVTSVSATTADGAYNTGDVIAVTVTFSENVTVSGTPQLTLETGATDAVVNFTSVSDATLTFNYTIASGHLNSDLDYTSTTALALNSGTIRDAATNNATLTLPTPGASGSLAVNKALVSDGVLPIISSVALAANNATIAVTMSEAVYNTTSSDGSLEAEDFALSISGGQATMSSATPSSISENGNVYTLGLSLNR
ncbi:uncharacterized protein METZ01_LOCUS120222, partial [marine metagenome]